MKRTSHFPCFIAIQIVQMLIAFLIEAKDQFIICILYAVDILAMEGTRASATLKYFASSIIWVIFSKYTTNADY